MSTDYEKNLEPVLILGAGAWGSALAHHIAKKRIVYLWDRDESLISELSQKRIHPAFNQTPLHQNIHFTQTIPECENVLIAIASSGFTKLLNFGHWLTQSKSVAIASKGILTNPPYFLPEVFSHQLKEKNRNSKTLSVVMLSGPSFATEVFESHPTGINVASTDINQAKKWSEFLHFDYFRVYLSDDPLGVSIFAALKNVYAIVCGIASGAGFGANTQALLISRSLAEMNRFSQHFGADPKTLSSLAGLGDLILTSSDDLSRNRSFGVLLGAGLSFNQAEKKLGKLVEGMNSLKPIYQLKEKANISMPLLESLYQLTYQNQSIKTIINQLFSREINFE